jgi:F-type H+-transporting ATPase subunit epsilon
MSFHLTILTPDARYFEGEAEAVIVPGLKGVFGVLPRHAPMVAALVTGILQVNAQGAVRFFIVDGGVAEVKRDSVAILTESVLEAQDSSEAEQKVQELLAEARAMVR